MKRATCFFCYSWSENCDYEIIDFLKKKIEMESNIKVTLDRHSYSYNSNIKQKIKEIKKHDIVVIFLTPELKAILMAPRNSRDRIIREEYETIQEMYKKNSSLVFPVILRGDRETAIFPPYENNICPYVMDFVSKKQGQNGLTY